MRRFLMMLGGGLVATSLAAGPAWATTTTTTTKAATRHVVQWRDVAGVFRTKAAADKRMSALDAKGVTGFTVLTLPHRKAAARRFEVEQTFPTHAAAKAEAAKVRADGITVRVVAV
ncbi:MAG TPA: hypothetical protein VFJ85_05270 [Acidimicrobiales bacterium]|nr:hypothetical protein [Acidimicrobiales bacterium]